jgi:hypothetical protein
MTQLAFLGALHETKQTLVMHSWVNMGGKSSCISAVYSLESIDWCSVIKLQINIANNYFGREQL